MVRGDRGGSWGPNTSAGRKAPQSSAGAAPHVCQGPAAPKGAGTALGSDGAVDREQES